MKTLSSEQKSQVWKLAWPILVGMGSHIFFHLVDMYWVGYLGTDALSGVAAAGSLMMLLWTGSRVAHSGGVAVMSQAFGRKDERALREGAADSMIVAALSGIFVFAVFYALLSPVTQFYSLGEKAHDAALAYLAVSLLGTPLMYLLEALTAYAIGVGETKVLMLLGLATSTVNMVLDPYFMFGWWGGPQMGIAGAALASVISTALLLVSLFVWQIRHIGIGLSDFRTAWNRIRNIIAIGAPAAVKDISRPLSVIILIRLISSFGDDIVAAYGLSMRLMGIVVIYMVAIATSLTTLAGKLIGEKNVEVVPHLLRYGGKSALVVHLVFLLPMCVFAGPVLGLFDNKGDVVAQGIPIVRVFMVMMTFALVTNVTSAAFRGSGYTNPIMISALVSRWLVMVPGCWIVVRHFQSTMTVWYVIAFSSFVEMTLILSWYAKGTWKMYNLPVESAEAGDIEEVAIDSL